MPRRETDSSFPFSAGCTPAATSRTSRCWCSARYRRPPVSSPLEQVISALICTRILIQFIAQIAAVTLLRRQGGRTSGFRMALYPLPSVIALIGWVFIFATSGIWYIVGGVGTLAVGTGMYAVWSRLRVEEPSS